MIVSTAVRVAPRIARQNTRAASSAIATKYSQAAYGAALSKSPTTLDTVQKELVSIGAALKTDASLAAFVHNPTLSTKDRQAGLEALYAKAGSGKAASEVTKNLFAVMAENGRLGETEEVVAGFAELVAKYKGELEVTVTSAKPLEKDVLARLEKALKGSQVAQAAKTVKITNKVKESLIGGLVVDFGDKSIDLSVASRVNKINTLLQGKASPLLSLSSLLCLSASC
ncbi:ATP synthase subunit 5 [Clavulina sp. PMI_390]|nr:ATP synthase subunit 5 [Clavulina sp. PMI_390]